MEQNYSYEELLAKLELTIDNVENQKLGHKLSTIR